ncbi:hypothetical protein ACFPYN_13580 [Paenisporosarcina macmurdoensis]|uniref:DUF4083 domain-containing protein n=1 Tax=Paenisporosarcina macmurdoensis TaxID=212659 RepID=A0ABW1L9T3_9BACL
MDLLFVILLFAVLIALYDSIRRVSKNVLKQTEELQKLREELQKNEN